MSNSGGSNAQTDYTYLKWVAQKTDLSTTWEELLLASDSDFVAFILLSSCGILDSTSLWMGAHSIEKYLKSWILKDDPTFRPSSKGHKLDELWSEANQRFSNNKITANTDFGILVDELNMDHKAIHVRYTYGIEIGRAHV